MSKWSFCGESVLVRDTQFQVLAFSPKCQPFKAWKSIKSLKNSAHTNECVFTLKLCSKYEMMWEFEIAYKHRIWNYENFICFSFHRSADFLVSFTLFSVFFCFHFTFAPSAAHRIFWWKFLAFTAESRRNVELCEFHLSRKKKRKTRKKIEVWAQWHDLAFYFRFSFLLFWFKKISRKNDERRVERRERRRSSNRL